MTNYKEELERFAYIVSHDLNAPLRQIHQFGNLLFNQLGDKVDDQERQYLEIMQGNVEKIQDMIAALLKFSRLNSHELNITSIPLPGLLADLVLEVGQIHTGNHSITLEAIPETLEGDRQLIKDVFLALMLNATTFVEEGETADVKISSKTHGDYVQFSVSDSGIGIKKEFREDVFEMFRRLHPSDVYPSLGAGLTLAKKAVELHGGSIEIIDNEPAGTTVLFQLPLSYA